MDNSKLQNQPNNLTKPTFNDPNDDKEYQNILNQYADVLSKNPQPTEDIKTETVAPLNPIENINPILETSPEANDLTDISSMEINPPVGSPIEKNISDEKLKIEEPIETTENPPTIPEETLVHPSLNNNIDDDDDEIKKSTTPVENLISQAKTIASSPRPSLDDQSFSPVPPSSKFNIFKIAFIASLILFLGVGAAFAFSLFNTNTASNTEDSNSTPIVKTTPAPTVVETEFACEFGGKQYKVGESFASEDGCNTCNCEEKDIISCTQKACLATKSATVITPTKAATATPSKAATSSTKKTTPTPTKSI